MRISGDSMEPRFENRQWVYVQDLTQGTELLREDEAGIFLYDGEAYCKILSHESSHPVLLSLNQAYQPLPITVSDSYRWLGRVVG